MAAIQPEQVSVLIPALNEAEHLPRLLQALQDRGFGQCVVADGGSRDETVVLARASGAEVVVASGGRGPQLQAAAARAHGDILWIVHADAQLPDHPLAAMAGPLGRGNAGAFTLRILHSAWRYRVVEWGARIRNAWTGLPYGDQGLFLTRALYDAVGGFEPIPIMEDVALGRAIRRAGQKIEVVSTSIGTDPRRWEREGVVRRTLKNWSLALRYQVLGADPHHLVNAYRPHKS